MNPKNHKALTDLFNIGEKKSEQQDVSEQNRIRIHRDAISAVMVTFNGEDHLVDHAGHDSVPPNVDQGLFMSNLVMPMDSEGAYVNLNRKRLLDILKGMTSDTVTLHIKKSNGMLLICGNYEGEGVGVMGLICPRIEPEDEDE